VAKKVCVNVEACEHAFVRWKKSLECRVGDDLSFVVGIAKVVLVEVGRDALGQLGARECCLDAKKIC